jgi:hypothetical protein
MGGSDKNFSPTVGVETFSYNFLETVWDLACLLGNLLHTAQQCLGSQGAKSEVLLCKLNRVAYGAW